MKQDLVGCPISTFLFQGAHAVTLNLSIEKSGSKNSSKQLAEKYENDRAGAIFEKSKALEIFEQNIRRDKTRNQRFPTRTANE